MSENLQFDSGNYTINAMSFVIEEIAEKFTFVKMLKQLSEYMEIDLLHKDCHFTGPLLFGGDFKEWLENSYAGFYRFDRNRDNPKEPADWRWYLSLRPITFKLSKRFGIEMLAANLDYWKERLSSGRDKDFPFVLSFHPILELNDGCFKISGHV